MKPIKTFHQNLNRCFDTETAELNYVSDNVRLNYSACLSYLKGALILIHCQMNITNAANNKHMPSL